MPKNKLYGVQQAMAQVEQSKSRRAAEYKRAFLAVAALSKLTRISIKPTHGYQGNCRWQVNAFGKIFYNYDLIEALREVAILGSKLYEKQH